MFNWKNFWMIFIGSACIGAYIRLREEKKMVGYFSKYTRSQNYPSFSMCIPLTAATEKYPLIDNCKNLENQTNPYVLLICFVSKLDRLIPADIIKYAESLDVHEMFNITLTNHQFKKSSIYINDFHLCISYQIFCFKNFSHSSEEDYKDTSLSDIKQFDIIKWNDVEFLNPGTWTPHVMLSMFIINKYKVSSKLFIHPTGENGYYFSLYQFNQFCNAKPLNESECNSGQLIVSRTNYTRLKPPYVTNCFDYTKAKFNFSKNRIFSRVSCLEECRKSIFTNVRSYYSKNDDKVLKQKSNINYNATFCLSKCRRPDCSHNFYYVVSWKNLTTLVDTALIKVTFLMHQYDIVAYSKTSNLSFLLQMVSYLCLVLNNNLIVQIIKLHKELVSKLVAFEFTKRLGELLGTEFVHLRVHFIALILALVITFKVSSNILYEMDNKLNSYISFAHYPTNYTHIIVTICFPIIDILKRPDFIASKFGSFDKDANQDSLVKLNDNLLEAFTFNELNSITKNETELIKAKIIFNGMRSMDLQSKVLTSFQPTYRLLNQTAHIVNLTLYGKCFSYNISFVEFPFQRIFRMTSVKFNMIGEQFSHFTITENNRFPNFRDHKLFTVCHLHRLVEKIESFQAGCKKYDDKYSTSKCYNKYECVDVCIKFKYARIFKKIPFTSIYRDGELIKDKDGVTITKAETLMSQKNTMYNTIRKKCEKKFPFKDCANADYVNFQSCSDEDFDFSQIWIKLYLTSIVELQQDKWSLSELLNQATTLLSVLFGFSVPTVFKCLIQPVSLVFKKNLYSKKLRRIIRAFLCIAMVHSFNMILTRASEGNPIPNTLYSAYDTFKLPRVTTCYKYDLKKIHSNYLKLNKTLTGYDLDKETDYMKIEKIYKTISFYSPDLVKVNLKFKDLAENQNFRDFNITFNRFFFQNYKCFNVHVNVTYETSNNNLFFIDDIMRLYLEQDAPIRDLHFSLSPENTINFNELNKIYPSCIHLVSFETFKVTNIDYFKYIRNPRLMFYKAHSVYNEEKYLSSLSTELAKHNLTSVILPIYEKDFHLKIDYNRSLEIYMKEILPSELMYSPDPDYERLIFKSIKMYKQVKNFTLLIINPSFLYFNIDYTNREDPSVIIMYLLNSVSFWLDINYVDYPKVIGRVFKGVFKMIRRLKDKL